MISFDGSRGLLWPGRVNRSTLTFHFLLFAAGRRTNSDRIEHVQCNRDSPSLSWRPGNAIAESLSLLLSVLAGSSPCSRLAKRCWWTVLASFRSSRGTRPGPTFCVPGERPLGTIYSGDHPPLLRGRLGHDLEGARRWSANPRRLGSLSGKRTLPPFGPPWQDLGI